MQTTEEQRSFHSVGVPVADRPMRIWTGASGITHIALRLDNRKHWDGLECFCGCVPVLVDEDSKRFVVVHKTRNSVR